MENKETDVVETDIIQLTSEEIKVLQEYQKMVENEKTNLGNLRLQFLLSERNIINKVEKAQNDFYSHLKLLSQSKDVPITGEWLFDPTAYVFRKKI